MSTYPENVQNFLKKLHDLGLHMQPGHRGNRKIDDLIKKYREKHELADWTDKEIEELIIDIYKISYKVPPHDESDTDISPDEMETSPTSGMDGGALKFKNKRRKSKKKKKKSKKKKKKSKK